MLGSTWYNGPMAETKRTTLTIPDDIPMADLCGAGDELLRLVQDAVDARVTVRGNVVDIEGDAAEVQQVTALFGAMTALVREGDSPDADFVRRTMDLTRSADCAPSDLRNDVLLSYRGHAIRPKTAGQKRYVDAIRSHTITFGMGPAGTGKTYLAMAMALAALQDRRVKRIILTRPIVEAGESLGFLPGTLFEKVDPYIRPLYDALYDMSDNLRTNQLIEEGTIEIAPLAFMRGRTLNDCFVILDEAQNATPEQLKMFLTRLGNGSKMVITGDATQTDLPRGASGFAQVRSILDGVDDIAFCDFGGKDVVRHSLVAAIVEAYDRADQARASKTAVSKAKGA